MIPKSIRWRLPLSYASIALLATLVLGLVLLTTLRGYFAQREHDNLLSNAQVISDAVTGMFQRQIPQDQIDSQIGGLSFLSQARIRLFNTQGTLLSDSGDPQERQIVALNYRVDRPAPDAIFFTSGTVSPSPTDDAAGFWISGMSIAAPVNMASPGTPVELPLAGAASGAQFTVALSGSPFGVGLKREITLASRSDQMVSVPVSDGQKDVLGSLELSNGPAYGTEIIESVTAALIGAGALAALLAAAVGWFMSRQITAPLLLLTDATAQMATGKLSARVPLARSDEFGVLSHSFNNMAQRVEATVAALRRFVADAAHEMHTPLTAIHADLELAASEPDEQRRVAFVERALAQLKRIEALTDSLLDLSRIEAHATDERRAPLDLVAFVREISEYYASRAEQAGIAFSVETPPSPVHAQVNEAQMRRAVGNLLDNAIKFTPENGAISIGVRQFGHQVELWVNDTGIGIAPEDLPHLFNRFHRGRNAAAYPGSGLGLAIIKAIVEGHSGQVSVESAVGQGTHFALRLPA